MKLSQAIRVIEQKRDYIERRLLVAKLMDDRKHSLLSRDVRAMDMLIEVARVELARRQDATAKPVIDA
jgi:bacterioferritin (cytochrome b1)